MKKFFVFLFLMSFFAEAQSFLQKDRTYNEVRPELKDVGIDEKLGDKIDLSLTFKNEKAEEVPLSLYFSKNKPILLSLVYYTCPSLCNFHINGLTDAFKDMDWTVGDEFEVIQVSIDPSETPVVANAKKQNYLKEYGREGAARGWHFLTGTEENIKKLAAQVGFKYKWVEEQKEWAHSAAATVMSPEGKITRYLYGISFQPKTVRLSLVEASNGKVGGVLDKITLFCFQYDPEKRGYAFYAFHIMRAGMSFTAIVLFLFLGRFWWVRKREGVS